MTEELKPHQIAQLVNKLRDIATKYHAHGCLRELISCEVNAALTQRPAEQAEPDHAAEIARLKAVIDQLERREILAVAQQAAPEPVKHKCRHCGVTTIEDEDGVTMQGLPAPEHPIIFDPSADVPIPAPSRACRRIDMRVHRWQHPTAKAHLAGWLQGFGELADGIVTVFSLGFYASNFEVTVSGWRVRVMLEDIKKKVTTKAKGGQ